MVSFVDAFALYTTTTTTTTPSSGQRQVTIEIKISDNKLGGRADSSTTSETYNFKFFS